MKKRWIIPIVLLIIILIGVVGYFVYYFYAFTQLKIADVSVTNLTDFSLKGFSFSGHISVYNPNLISVSIKQVEYDIVFEPTGQLLSAGILEGKKLPSKQITEIPFQKTINWAPALSMVIQLVTSNEPANIVLSGKVIVTETIKLPFEYKLDLRPYFQKVVEEQKQATVEKAVETLEEKYGKTVSAIAEHIAKYLPI
ncbi:LEA type 2 family protein [Candidatus Woesearchaeota archaeon]|nr:LEA type 2 family protein [Candidatus Woesearchaeota archaeon]